MISDEIRYWPYSSKPVGGKLLDMWADKIAQLEAEIERLRKILDAGTIAVNMGIAALEIAEDEIKALGGE